MPRYRAAMDGRLKAAHGEFLESHPTKRVLRQD